MQIRMLLRLKRAPPANGGTMPPDTGVAVMP
jgi:hypothetical protein